MAGPPIPREKYKSALLRIWLGVAAVLSASYRASAADDTLVVKTIAGLHGWPLESAPPDEPAPTIAVSKAGKIYTCAYRGSVSLLWEIDPRKGGRGLGYVDAKGALHTNPALDFKVRLFGERLTNIQEGPFGRQQDDGPGFVDTFVPRMFGTVPVRPICLALSPKGDVYVSSIPIAVDADGNIYFAVQSVVERLLPDGTVQKLAGFNAGFKDGRGTEVEFGKIAQLAVDPAGRILIADSSNNAVRLLTPAGDVSTLVGPSPGAGGYLMPSSLQELQGIAAGAGGKVYILEKYSRGIKVATADGSVNYLGDTEPARPRKFPAGWRDGPVPDAQFAGPQAIVAAPDGAVYVVDTGEFTGHWTVRRIALGPVMAVAAAPTDAHEQPRPFHGKVSTIASNLGATSALTIDRAGNLYVAITRQDTADPWTATVERIGADGARTIVAGTTAPHAFQEGNDHRFLTPRSVIVDPTGVVFVSDPNREDLVQVLPNGEVYKSLLRNGLDLRPGASMVLSKSGSIYLADSYRHIVRRVSPAGNESVLAGNDGFAGEMDGQGAAALFRGPSLVAVDAQDTVFVSDGSAVRRITADGTVTTLAGAWGATGSADGPGNEARFTRITGIAAAADGSLFVADADVIRWISPAGFVQTIAGKRRAAFEQFVPDSYDGQAVPIEHARFLLLHDMVVGRDNRLYVLDGPALRRVEFDSGLTDSTKWGKTPGP